MAYFEHDGINFYYEIRGEGPTIVFTHGLGGDLIQPKYLLGVMEGYRIVLCDVRGNGRTEPVGPEEKLNFATFAHDLKSLFDHVGINTAVVGGISMGAGISAAFAVKWPEQVRALVLVRPAWMDQPAPPNLIHLPGVKRLLDAAGPDADLQKCCSLEEYEPIKRLPAELRSILEDQLTKPKAYERRARLERVTKSCPIISWSEVEALTMPTLVVGNSPDAAHPMEMAEEWARRVPDGRLAVIPPKTDINAHRAEFQKHFRKFLVEKVGQL